MKLNYHKDTDSLYIDLANVPSVESEELSQDLIVDYDAEGNIVGIDIQHASTRLDLSRIETTDLPLPVAAVALAAGS